MHRDDIPLLDGDQAALPPRLQRFLLVGALLAIGILAFFAPSAAADDSFSARLGIGNAACGSGEPFGGLTYDRDSDDIPVRFSIDIGPNGSCTGQSVAVSGYAAKRHYITGPWFGVAVASYDSRTVPFEYVRPGVADPFKHFHGERVEAVRLEFGPGYDCGDNCSVRLVFNAVDTPLAAGGHVGPVAVLGTYQVFGVEANARLDDTVQRVDFAWRAHGMVRLGRRDVGRDRPCERRPGDARGRVLPGRGAADAVHGELGLGVLTMRIGTIRVSILTAIIMAALVAAVGVWKVTDPDHVVTICNGFVLAVVGLGNKIVESDMGGPPPSAA